MVKKCHFFNYLFSVKIGLEKRFSNVLDTKQTMFDHKKFNILKSQKSHFSKGVNPSLCQALEQARLTHAFGQKKPFFYRFVFKIRLEKRFKNINVLDIKETIFGHKKFTISKSQKSHFSKRVNPCFLVKKCHFFYLFFSVKTRLKKRFSNVLDTKQTIFDHKKCNILKSQKSHFSKGVKPSLCQALEQARLTHAFGQKMPFFYRFAFGQNKTRKKV